MIHFYFLRQFNFEARHKIPQMLLKVSRICIFNKITGCAEITFIPKYYKLLYMLLFYFLEIKTDRINYEINLQWLMKFQF